jgi:hypothetical protein
MQGVRKKIPMLEPAWYRNKRNQSGTGMLLYQTEIPDSGMQAALMPIPSYRVFAM